MDLDWEYPGDTSRGGRTSDKESVGLLVETIREAFDTAAANLELSMAIPASE